MNVRVLGFPQRLERALTASVGREQRGDVRPELNYGICCGLLVELHFAGPHGTGAFVGCRGAAERARAEAGSVQLVSVFVDTRR